MGKVNESRLFDTFQAASGPHAPAREGPSRRGDSPAEKHRRKAASGPSPAPLIGADELALAVRQTFDARRDRVLWTARGMAAPFSHHLRFDEARPDAAPAHSVAGHPHEQFAGEATDLLTQGLGMALARDALGDDYWIVVVLDAAQSGAGPTPKLIAQLARLRRVLVVCCDGSETDEAADADVRANGALQLKRPAQTLIDLLSRQPGLGCLGPVSGLETDGLLAIFEALKTTDQPAVLHLRLMPDETSELANGQPSARSLRSAPPDLVHPAAIPSTQDSDATGSDAVRTFVESRRLSQAVETWVRAYGAFGKRGLYLWKWARCGVDLTTLPCVEPQWRSDVCDTKVLSIMLCVLLDDVADQHGKQRLLESLLQIAGSGSLPEGGDLAEDDRHYLQFTGALAEEYETRARRYPRYDDYLELLQYDQAQFFNALRYSHILNRRPVLLNVAEHDLYLPHNMHMMSFAMLDLMCSPGFDDRELGRLREATWHAQCMGRIGNLLATWPRELRVRDFTSGVFARAVAAGDLTIEQLHAAEPRDIEAAIRRGRHERHFLDRWKHHRRCFAAAAVRIRSVSLEPLVEAHERFLRLHLESRGLI
jgi:hypothetical protein